MMHFLTRALDAMALALNRHAEVQAKRMITRQPAQGPVTAQAQTASGAAPPTALDAGKFDGVLTDALRRAGNSAAPVETSLQILVRLAQLTHMPDGERVQSIELTCGMYACARVISTPAIGAMASCRTRMHSADGTRQLGLVFGRCFLRQSADYQPDQWRLVIYPMNGKAKIYEGMVE